MNINTTETGALILIVIMMVVTIVTRWGGIYIMSFVPISQRVQRFIAAMSGSVLVAIIAPMFLTSDLGGKLALLITALGTLFLKRPLLSITAGLAVAAITRTSY
ncbi:AzlD family protein [Vibrio ostreicida]|uniref:AzlD domain-containing protein n=1 Tax=Vibrio ostreicida TaxID=526588 RepID=A0ABT8BV48_9VIBR|nr:AzlD domain-containing protein [Vibrio ostreicida]MDN3609968.1 AzlD domain-containing protein [Vibrio ostreicida]NPD10393.1 AzlD domain-containing protein [Vibrio ostreicida]